MSVPLTPEAVDSLEGAQVHVVGLAGTEGAAITRFLAARGVRNLVAHDLAEGEALKQGFMRFHVGMPKIDRLAMWEGIEGLDITIRGGEDYLHGIDQADVIFASQGWYLYPRNRPTLDHARERGTPFYGLMHLYFGLAKARTVAVTGSNGKSTTSRMIEHMLEAGGHRVWYAGNERRSVQVLDRLEEMKPEDLLVLEVSNRHLIDLEPRPDIAVITNVLPNHLSEHDGSFDAYKAVKRRLIERQDQHQLCILNADDTASLSLARGIEAQTMWFSRERSQEAGAWVHEGNVRLRDDRGEFGAGRADALPLPGEHNVENLLAASLAAWSAGAEPSQIESAVPSFRGLRHRTQFVWSVDGVEYFDDLNATSPQATIAAITALRERPIVLIAGGDEKGLEMAALGEKISAHVRWLVLLPGAGSDAIQDSVGQVESDAQIRIDRFDDFGTAVRSIMEEVVPGERVLLSPACPGFFSKNYGGTGEEIGFRALLRTTTTRERAERARETT